MHLALTSEATGPSLRVATHETLHTKSSAIELMHNSHLLIVLHHFCFRDVHGNVVFPPHAMT